MKRRRKKEASNGEEATTKRVFAKSAAAAAIHIKLKSTTIKKPVKPSVRTQFGACKVCQDKASGVHYGVASCEGCKGFFKRSLYKHAKYKCKSGNKCKLTLKRRINCKACRWKTCLEVGMSEEAIKMGRIPKKVDSSTENGDPSPQESHNSQLIREAYQIVTLRQIVKKATCPPIMSLRMSQLTAHTSITSAFLNTPLQTNLLVCNILRDRAYQSYLEHIGRMMAPFYEKAQELARLKLDKPPGQDVNKHDLWAAYMAHTKDTIETTVKFIKSLPGFAQLNPGDLQVLLKKRTYMVTGFFKFKMFINNEYYLLLPEGIQFTKENVFKMSGSELGAQIIGLFGAVSEMRFEDDELALIVPYVLTLAESDKILYPQDVQKLNAYYQNALMYEFDLNARSDEFYEKFKQILLKFPGLALEWTSRPLDL